MNILNFTPALTVIVNEDLTIFDISRSACSFFNLNYKEVLGKSFNQVFFNDDNAERRKLIADILETNPARPVSLEGDLVSFNIGSNQKLMDVRLLPFSDENGNKKVIITLNDETKDQTMFDKFKEQVKDLEAKVELSTQDKVLLSETKQRNLLVSRLLGIVVSLQIATLGVSLAMPTLNLERFWSFNDALVNLLYIAIGYFFSNLNLRTQVKEDKQKSN